MKKYLFVALCVCFSFFICGCEEVKTLRVASINDITVGQNYSIKVVLGDDERMSEKYVDLQIRSNKDNLILDFSQEGEKGNLLTIEEKDSWYNLTYLISQNSEKSEKYQKYDDFGAKIFNFSTNFDAKLTFRVVVGDVVTNEKTSEEIFILSEDVSKEVCVDVKN